MKCIESRPRIPSIYDGDLNDEETLLDWLVEQKTTETIEKVTEKILEMLVEEEEYLAVFFRVVQLVFTLEDKVFCRVQERCTTVPGSAPGCRTGNGGKISNT